MENKRDRHCTEEEIKDKIVQSAEGMEVPDSLKPENIEKKLAQDVYKRQTQIPMTEIALPIGISFFTFQALSYVIDVYRDEVQSQKSVFNVMPVSYTHLCV